MNRFPIIALMSSLVSLAVGCSDDSSSDTGQGGTQSAESGGTDNSSSAGTAGSSSAAAGSGGSSNGASGAGGDSAGGSSAGGASGASGMGGASSSGNLTVEDVCQRGCVKTESLDCPNDPTNCEAACLADYLDFPAECRPLVLTLGDCAADRPASDFLCDEEGESILAPGICGPESIAVATCLLDAL